MSLIVRIDVDRPYGRHPMARHILSRLASDWNFPRIEWFRYLVELEAILRLLNEGTVRAYVFFRRCTLPSQSVLRLLEDGQHEVGLHLEDSRSFESFVAERNTLERHLGKKVMALSKHGSRGKRYGYYHHPPYEPEKYVKWADQTGMKVVLGNLEDPSIGARVERSGLTFFPGAFWLEPPWRDTKTFDLDWLLSHARCSDVVLLVHPENVLESPDLTEQFNVLVRSIECRVLD